MVSGAVKRLMQALDSMTLDELAQYMGVNRSEVEDVIDSGELPDTWILRAVRKSYLNPGWLENGVGPELLLPVQSSDADSLFDFALLIVMQNKPRLLEHFKTSELIGEAYRRN